MRSISPGGGDTRQEAPMRRLLNSKALTAGLAIATLGFGLATSPAQARMGFGGFHGGFGGFHGGFGGMRLGGFHRGFGGMRTAGFHPGFARPAFVSRPFAFNRPFVRPAFVNRPFAFNRPFFFRRHHRFPAGVFAAGLVG